MEKLVLAALRAQMAGKVIQPPVGAGLLWGAFNRLSKQRSWHANGPNPITFAEIEAYCRVMRLPLEPRHISILLAMDAVWLDGALSRLRSKFIEKELSPRQGITTSLWDAMFS